MKKGFSIFLLFLFASSIWAADVTVTESFQTWPYQNAQSTRLSYNGDNYLMYARGVRFGASNDKLNDGTKGFWMSRGASSSCYVETDGSAVGGVKAVSFKWRQFGAENTGTQLVINVKVGSSVKTISCVAGNTYINTDQTFSETYNETGNVKVTVQNATYINTESTAPSSGGRIILGPITITPYLYYGTRDVTISTIQQGYVNNTLINNTGATPAFSSSKTSVATVNATTGVVTPIAAGDATISAKWEGVTVKYVVHVVDDKLVENFPAVGTVTKAVASESTWEGDVRDWKVKGVRRAWNDTVCNNPKKQGIWSSNGAYMETVDTIEGGIKHVTFGWKQWGSENNNTLKTIVTAGTKVESQEVDGKSAAAATYNTFDKEMEAKDGVKLRIDNASYLSEGTIEKGKGRYVIENIQITPYLLYTQKTDMVKISAGTYTNSALINNTGATPTYKSSNEAVATIATDGTVTLLSVGTTTITAKWEEVYTSYELQVLDNVTLVTFDANKGDGTFMKPISYGKAMPEIELPTRAGYAFNAYFLTNDGKTRFTVTNDLGTTKFLVSLKVGEVNYTDANRKWIYQGDEMTLYAQWKKKRTITLHNQEATTPGTEDVKIAYCFNNSFEKLGTIECPTKEGYIFKGYFTEENGEGKQLVDKDGKFLASVEAFTNQYYQWILDKDTFLYANWEAKKCTITLKSNYTDGPEDVVFEATYGQASPLTTSDVHTRENYTMYRGYWMDPVTESKGTRLVNPTGKFTTDVSGYTIGQNWAYDAEEDITLYAHWTLDTLVLKEDVDNSTLLSQYNGKTADVKITRSNLVANVWNSLCLPFAIAKSDLGTAQVVEMTGATMKGETIEVEFKDVTSDELTAGTPYLVKPEAAAVTLDKFTGKTIVATPTPIHNNDLIELTGIYSPYAMTANDKSKLFLAQPDGQGNNLFFASEDGNLKGMRAYFSILSTQAPVRVGRMVINKETVATELENVNANENATQKVIIDGQLIIIRNGVYYDVNGQIVK